MANTKTFKRLHADQVRHIMTYRVTCANCGATADFGNSMTSKAAARLAFIDQGWQQGPDGTAVCGPCVAIATSALPEGTGLTTSAPDSGAEATAGGTVDVTIDQATVEASADASTEGEGLVDVTIDEATEGLSAADEAAVATVGEGDENGGRSRRSRRH